MAEQRNGSTGKGLVENFRGQVNNLSAQAREETGRLAREARDEVQGLVRRRKDRVADRLGSFASALRDAGQRLEGEGGDGLSAVAERAAHQVDRASRYLRERETRELAQDLEHFARQRPGVFVGGSLAAGFLLARFLKSSGERASAMQSVGPGAREL